MLQRKTIVSTKVIDFLQKSKNPVTIVDILNKLKEKGLEPNKSTIYRILNKLIDQNQVKEVIVRDRAAHFELIKEHHNHFVCQLCEKVLCPHQDEFSQITPEKLMESKKFKVNSIDFNIYGICQPCLD